MRAKRKWSFMGAILLGGCLGGVLLLHQMKKMEKKRQKMTTQLAPFSERVTWSQFQDYKRLKMLFEGFSIHSILDLPSIEGVEHLQKYNLGIQQYIGVTPSKEQARLLQQTSGSAQYGFIHADLGVDPLPQVDLILGWDSLCRLPYSQIGATLLQFKKSGSRFLLIRHYPYIEKNHKNRSGTLQPINWRLAPYYFPEPIIQLVEKKERGVEVFALWKLEDLK